MSQVHHSFGFPLSVGVLTDVGRIRTNNEDSFGTAWLVDGSLFCIVADGMGGHEAGEVASSLAVQVVEEVVSREVDADPRERIYAALLEANEAILDEGQNSGTRGMGTTSIVSVIKGNQAYIGLIGDSRCFHFRKGHLLWRTSDHTRVQMLIEQGKITEDQARTHPEAGMLTRALGHSRMADGRALVPDVLEDPLHIEADDTLVLSSDGLHDLVEDWEIGQVIADKTCEEAAEALVNLACERGGHDNVTVAVINAGPRASEFDPDFEPTPWQASFVPREGVAEENITYDEPSGGQVSAPTPPAAAPVPVLAKTGVVPSVSRPAPGMPDEAPKPNRNKLYIGLGVGAVLVVGGGAVLVAAIGAAFYMM